MAGRLGTVPPGAKANVALDADGLLAALVLSPATYSRNQHFELYRSPNMRSVQRRARVVRGLVRLLLREEEKTVEFSPTEIEVVVRVHVPALGLRRTAHLTLLEFELVEFMRARALGERPPSPQRVDQALLRLSGFEP